MEHTTYLGQKIEQCDDMESFRQEILPELMAAKEKWSELISKILSDNNYSKTEMAQLCGVSRTAVSKWCNGSLPNSREDYIKIGFAANYSLEQMNFFLKRYGKYPGLYAKSLEDSVVIFVLKSHTQEHSYARYLEILYDVKGCLNGEPILSKKDVDTRTVYQRLSNVSSVPELRAFVTQNAFAYQKAYSKFYACVNAYIAANNMDYVSNKPMSVNALADMQNCSSSLRQCVSAIRQKKWFPLRRKIIALGLHLNMNVEQINEMLKYSHMEPLCASNPVEGTLIFAVTDADLRGMIFQDGSMELCNYVKEVFRYVGLEDADGIVNDL